MRWRISSSVLVRCLCSSLILALLHSTLPLAIHSFIHSFIHSQPIIHSTTIHSIINLDKTKKNTIIETMT